VRNKCKIKIRMKDTRERTAYTSSDFSLVANSVFEGMVVDTATVNLLSFEHNFDTVPHCNKMLNLVPYENEYKLRVW